jgi:HAD superfamily hydrolase (TIGR01662 family)
MNIKTVGLDVDGTIRYSFKDERKRQPIDGAKEIIAKLKDKGIKLFVATNQAGPTWAEAYARNRQKEKANKYPDIDEVAKDIVSFAKEVNLFNVPWYIATYDERIRNVLKEGLADPEGAFRLIHETIEYNMQWFLQNLPDTKMQKIETRADPSWRKPEPGMIQRAATELECLTSEILYVGDMDTDEQAAQNAGARFFDVRKHSLEEILEAIDVSERP